MQEPEIKSFLDALDDSEVGDGGRHVLLGNGFSIACRPGLFSYDSLYESAELDQLHPQKSDLFQTLDTQDFEVVMEHLSTASRLAALYGANAALIEQMEQDTTVVRNGLADVISKVHPDTRADLSDTEVDHTREFLSNFDSIFTTNYDLLLYWTLLRDTSPITLSFRDGFQWPTLENRRSLVWKSRVAESVQEVHYLHGALHLVRKNGLLHKLHYGSQPLMQQIRSSILEGNYPTIVTEGTSAEKRAQINRDEYLRFCHQMLTGAQGVLFIHGSALSANDDHVWREIESDRSGIDHLFVSIHGDPGDEGAQSVMHRANLMQARRRSNGGSRLQVAFYDATTANLWN